MTDKEQIIINGVDVSECENFRPKDRFTCHPYICNCHQKPNCYFKQLARKTQECEELKKKLSAANLEIENLKKELDKAYEWEQTNRATGICETCTEKANLTLDIYRDGMNKIEKLINEIKESGYNE